ncbi:GNAT family N-acetyltransferase [Acetobacterium bakii]|uniref:N-acetyltransferase domain-containing protein n=1 Tax=Acetobacterium bakii TaxID=52689 RepID=A0A0L6U174_9FIRM|nr:GNAT family N-acetyltransferase [Acetobacterium bakii]KNZ41550.1 hypothetical protein AKG39_11195 [Acetobacterium bakii]
MENIKRGINKFYMGDDEMAPIAEINFCLHGDKEISIDYVYVSNALRKQGIGKKLVDAVVAYARVEKRRIIPICSYAEKILTESNDYADVL